MVGLKATADRRLAVSGTGFGPAPVGLPEGAKLHIQGFVPMFCPTVALLETQNLKAWHPEIRAVLRSAAQPATRPEERPVLRIATKDQPHRRAKRAGCHTRRSSAQPPVAHRSWCSEESASVKMFTRWCLMWCTSVRRSRCCIVDIFGAGRLLGARRGAAASTRPCLGLEAMAGRRFEFVPLGGSRSYFCARIDRLVIRAQKYGLGTARGAKSERPIPKNSAYPPLSGSSKKPPSLPP